MSDQQLRTLERRFQETGAVEHEAAWLRARLQVGALSDGQLELAARFGHEPARLVRPDDYPRWQSLGGFHALARNLGQTTRLRLGVTAVHAAVRARAPDDPTLNQAIASVERWILCPCAGCGEEALALEADLLDVVDVEPRLIGAAQGLFDLLRRATLAHVTTACTLSWSVAPIAQQVEREMIAWTLGYADPVADRVAASVRLDA